MFAVCRHQIVECDVAKAGVVHVGRHGSGAVCGPNAACNKPRPVRLVHRELVRRRSGERGRYAVDIVHVGFDPVIRHADACCGKRIGLYDVGTGIEIGTVDGGDDIGPGQGQQVVVPLQSHRVIGVSLTTKIVLVQFIGLDHRAHGSVQHQDTALQGPSHDFYTV